MPTGVEREADAVETVGGEVGHQSSGVRSHHTERRVERGHVLQDHLLGRWRLNQASDLICWMEGDMSMYLFSASLAMLQSFSYPPHLFCIPVMTICPTGTSISLLHIRWRNLTTSSPADQRSILAKLE